MIVSYARIYTNITPELLGFPQLLRVFNKVCANSKKTPLIIDSDEFLKNPEYHLRHICKKMNVHFTPKMLHWGKGPAYYDGIWGEYWYKELYNSTGFKIQSTSHKTFPNKFLKLYDECLPYYTSIKNEHTCI